ncbi:MULTISPECIES: hypothetical protein [unclassified Nocardiopsis]|uniref:hypothetical protein n=1 Tax=Nocardiopsis TaxID=2013 RepID=UPI00387B3D4D
MEHPTTSRHRRPCHSMAGRMWALAAALLATALAALFSPRPARPPCRVPRALSAPPATTTARRGDPPGLPAFPAPDTWAAGAFTASARWERAYAAPADPVDDDPDRIAGALVRPYLDLAAVPRPRPAEPEDYPATSPAAPPPPAADPVPAEEEFAELTDRIRAYLALNPGKGERP